MTTLFQKLDMYEISELLEKGVIEIPDGVYHMTIPLKDNDNTTAPCTVIVHQNKIYSCIRVEIFDYIFKSPYINMDDGELWKNISMSIHNGSNTVAFKPKSGKITLNIKFSFVELNHETDVYNTTFHGTTLDEIIMKIYNNIEASFYSDSVLLKFVK